MPSARWRELLDERLAEAVADISAVPGVHGVIVGGSVGRGEPWPLSDIDLLPVYTVDALDGPAAASVARRQAELVDWWAASGRAQTLDLGWLAFTRVELDRAVESGPELAAARMDDPRWLHGIDKAYGGRPGHPDDGRSRAFLDWVGSVRFDPLVAAARSAHWHRQASEAHAAAVRARPGDPVLATHLLREGARALRLVLLEQWGERLGSMGREWTLFEWLARRVGEPELAQRLAAIGGADARTAAARTALAPAWLLERIDLALAARLAVGEVVTAEESARDQLAAFAVHVHRHHPQLAGAWMDTPDAALDARLADLAELLGALRVDA